MSKINPDNRIILRYLFKLILTSLNEKSKILKHANLSIFKIYLFLLYGLGIDIFFSFSALMLGMVEPVELSNKILLIFSEPSSL